MRFGARLRSGRQSLPQLMRLMLTVTALLTLPALPALAASAEGCTAVVGSAAAANGSTWTPPHPGC